MIAMGKFEQCSTALRYKECDVMLNESCVQTIGENVWLNVYSVWPIERPFIVTFANRNQATNRGFVIANKDGGSHRVFFYNAKVVYITHGDTGKIERYS